MTFTNLDIYISNNAAVLSSIASSIAAAESTWDQIFSSPTVTASTTTTSMSAPSPSGAQFHIAFYTWNDNGTPAWQMVTMPSSYDSCQNAVSAANYLTAASSHRIPISYGTDIFTDLPVTLLPSTCGVQNSNITISNFSGNTYGKSR
jgi:hypothetical protein